MRTTVEIDDEVLAGLKELARRQRMTLGQVVSDLGRRCLPQGDEQQMRNGVRLFPTAASGTSDMQVVNSLRDEG